MRQAVSDPVGGDFASLDAPPAAPPAPVKNETPSQGLGGSSFHHSVMGRSRLRGLRFQEAHGVMSACRRLLSAGATFVLLTDEQGGERESIYFDGEESDDGEERSVDSRLPPSVAALRDQALGLRIPVYENHFTEPPALRLHPDGVVILGNILYVPMIAQGVLRGVLGAINKAGGFTESDARVALQFGELVPSALDRGRRLEQFEESEERFRTLAESAHDAVILCDENGVITFWNRASERLFGHVPGDCLGNSVELVIPEHLREAHRRGMARCRDTGWMALGGKTVEVSAVTREGREIPVEIALASWEIRGRRHFGAMIRELTQRREAENKLAEANRLLEKRVEERTTELIRANRLLHKAKEQAESASKAKTRFLATMSHEIRTPLNTIIGMGELISETLMEEEQRRLLEISNRAGQSLLAILNNVLDLSKIEEEELDLEESRFQVRTFVNGTVDLVAWRAQDKGLEMVWTVDPDVPEKAVGDLQRLRQVLLNLLDNALKFTAKGIITLTVSKVTHRELLFTISDTGPGIPFHLHERIFQPFIQGDASTTRKYGGAGLGLTICRKLVRLMGGRIWLESVEGVGSTFHFSAPILVPETFRRKAVEPPAPAPAPLRPTQPLRLLIVDDLDDSLLLFKKFMKELPCKVDTASNGREALDKFKQGQYDIVLMDMLMPEMDGYTATREIRAWEKEQGLRPAAIIALTANAMKEDAQACLEAGCDLHLCKPIGKARLIETLSQYCRRE